MMKYLYIIAFVFVIILSALVLHQRQSISTDNHTGIDIYATHALLTEYDKTGHIKSTLLADTVRHDEKSGETLLEKPDLTTSSDDNHAVWRVSADHGVANKSGDQLILTGHVVIHEFPHKGNAKTVITTTELTIFPKKSIATTHKPIQLKRPGTIVDGVGFSANLKTGEYQLRSQSHAIITPEK